MESVGDYLLSSNTIYLSLSSLSQIFTSLPRAKCTYFLPRWFKNFQSHHSIRLEVLSPSVPIHPEAHELKRQVFAPNSPTKKPQYTVEELGQSSHNCPIWKGDKQEAQNRGSQQILPLGKILWGLPTLGLDNIPGLGPTSALWEQLPDPLAPGFTLWEFLPFHHFPCRLPEKKALKIYPP